MSRTVHQSDVMTYIQNYQGEKYHALFCDPPYELNFMGRKWDSTGIAFRKETWHGLGTLLYPGAFGMAFASTRGYHRMACAIEDAGMIIHPMMVWVFSSGFPKATRVKDAPAFSGHRYGGQALAPSLEPVVVFQKPYAGKPRDCIVATGAGALNIEAARIEGGNGNGHWTRQREIGGRGIYGGGGFSSDDFGNNNPASGRWAKNFILSHSPGCTMFECSPDCPVQRMDMQTGESISAASQRGIVEVFKQNNDWRGESTHRGHNDSGTGSRFFFNADYLLNRMEDTDPFIYAAKAGTTERDAGLQDFPTHTTQIKAIRDQSNPKVAFGEGARNRADKGETPVLPRRNPHPCIKPLALAQHFASLLLPPVEYAPRRLLVPFAGSGSEMIGALLAGWEHIDGIEMEADYVKIANARLDYWKAHQPNMAGKKKPKAAIKKVSALQMALL